MAINDEERKRNQNGATLYADKVRNSPGVSAVRAIGQGLGNLFEQRDRRNANANQFFEQQRQLAAARARSQAAPALVRPSFANVSASPATTVAQSQQPVRDPAVQAPQAGASAPGGGVPPSSSVIGTVNGRPVTRAEADRLAGALPTISGPAIIAPGGNLAAPTDVSPPSPRPDLTALAPQSATPIATLRRPDTSGVRASTEDRKALMGKLDSMLFANSFAAGRGLRSARELQGDLARTMAVLTTNGGDQATRAMLGDQETTGNLAIAQGQLAGTNNIANADRAQRAVEIATDATLRRDAINAPGRLVKDTLPGQGGTMSVLRNDGSITPLTGQDGKPFVAGTEQITAKDQLNFIGEQLKALNSTIAEVDPTVDVGAFQQLTAQRDALMQQANQLTSSQPQQAVQPPVPGAQKAQDGNWYIRNTDGSYSKVTP